MGHFSGIWAISEENGPFLRDMGHKKEEWAIFREYGP